jgi:hypothetical protein
VVAPVIRVILARRKHVCEWEEKRVLIVAHGFPRKVIHEAWCHCALPGLHLRVVSRASQIASSRRHTSYVPRGYTPFSPSAEYDRSAQLETSSHAFLLPARSRHRAHGRRPAPTYDPRKEAQIVRNPPRQRAGNANQRCTCLSVETDIHLNMWRTRASPAHIAASSPGYEAKAF